LMGWLTPGTAYRVRPHGLPPPRVGRPPTGRAAAAGGPESAGPVPSKRALRPGAPMRASASGATGDAIRTAVSRLDHRLGQRRLTGKGRKAARQLCWCRAPTISSSCVRRAARRRSSPTACGVQCSRRWTGRCDLSRATLLAGITRDARSGDMIEVHTQAMYDEVVRQLREAGRDDLTVVLWPPRRTPPPPAPRS
jgi:hypothetical protein